MPTETLTRRSPRTSADNWKPPAATDSIEQRREFAMSYVAWFLSQQSVSATSAPPDIRATHRWEIEFNSCVLDPVRYVADTRYELSLTDRASRSNEPKQ
jgi:hypothetical protein